MKYFKFTVQRKIILIGNSAMNFGLSAEVQYSSGYFTNLTKITGSHQDDFAKLNASARVYSQNQAWEFSLIGRNLTNELTIANGDAVVDAGFGVIAGADTMTGTAAGKGWDVMANVSRGREIWLKLTIRPFNFGK